MAEKEITDEKPIEGIQEALAGPSNYKFTSDNTTSQPTSSADFSSSLFVWREVNLPALQHSLETLCPTLVNCQKDALLSRKKLAEQTREFKKLNSEGQTEAIKPLLKSYQTEIDSLTKRAKSAENAVLSVRDRLQTASDPYPILEAVLVSSEDHECRSTVKQDY
jgi:homeobox protein cut-like